MHNPDFFVAHLSKLVEILVIKMCDLDARYQEELRIKDYEFSGDAYDDERYKELRQKWSVKPKPEGDQYLRLVRTASEAHWAHLRLLADFMEIGRIPRSWEKDLLPKDQQQRWGRTNIRIIDYSGEGVVRNEVVHDDTGLDAGKLKSKLLEKGQGDTEFRLYVVEDLSRNVIEVLGTEFQIDPEFFRAHIVDYSWYNVRDRWREPRPLEVFRKRRNWFQIRWMTARYCETEKDFEHAAEEAKGFNILRRPDHDGSKGWWDSEKAVVAQTRSKASYWLKPEKTSKPRLGKKGAWLKNQCGRSILIGMTRCITFGPNHLYRTTTLGRTRTLQFSSHSNNSYGAGKPDEERRIGDNQSVHR